MNRIVLIILLFTIWGCDTENNVKPLGEEYFIKFYGAIGNQEGVSVKATLDGGFIIGGNSVSEFGGQSDYLLIKVDAIGNQEWLETYDFNGTEEPDILTEVMLEGSDYIIAGTSLINGDSKMVLLQVDQIGQNPTPLIIDPTDPVKPDSLINSYVLKGISRTLSGEFMLVGPVINLDPDNQQKGKSIISIVSSTALVEQNHQFYPTQPSDDDLIFVKGLEVFNQTDQVNHYLVFGYINTATSSDVVLYQILASTGSEKNTTESKNISNTKSVDAIQMNDINFKILSSSEDESFLIDVFENLNGIEAGNYKIGAEQQILKPSFQGVSIQHRGNNQFAISANINEESSLNTLSTVIESSSNGVINWERIFGTEFSYKSGKVIELTDGSIVYTGTAGLKDQNKVFLIKMKSNGEMK